MNAYGNISNRRKQRTVNNIKVLKDNSKNIEVKEENIAMFPLKIKCSECDSELEITEEDTHIGWMGARFINCPCCGEVAMVDELEGITLTKDNLEFPVHFNRTAKGLRNVVEVNSNEIIKEIQKKNKRNSKLEKWDCFQQAQKNIPMIMRECIRQYKQQKKAKDGE